MGKGNNRNTEKVHKTLPTAISVNSKLPPHVIQVIFSKLSIVNLPCCRLVCKTWNDIVLDYHSSTFKLLPNPIFVALVAGEELEWPFEPKMFCINFDAKQHDDMIKFDGRFQIPYNLSGFQFVNSCNGLMCVEMMSETCCILNPMTNKYTKLPLHYDNFIMDTYFHIFYGLGFSLETKQYKIIRVSCGENYSVLAVDIVTMGFDIEWRSINFTTFSIYSMDYEFDCVYLNGALYCVGKDNENRKTLWRFDVEDENFEAISLPKEDLIDDYSVYIQVLNDRLYVNLYDGRKQPWEIEVWIMGSHEGKDQSWKRYFVIKNIPEDLWVWLNAMPLRFIKVYEDEKIIFFAQLIYCFFLYDLKNERLTKIKTSEERYIYNVCQIQSPNFDSLDVMVARDE